MTSPAAFNPVHASPVIRVDAHFGKNYFVGDLIHHIPVVAKLFTKHFSVEAPVATITRSTLGLDKNSIRANQVILTDQLNKTGRINKFLERVNEEVKVGTLVLGHAETSEGRKERVLKRYIRPINYLVYFFDFLVHRLLPKLSPFTSFCYFFFTRGKSRVLPKAEILGRLYSCGFIIKQITERNGYIYFVVEKKRCPFYNLKPSYGPLFRMKRVGFRGRIIQVYKLRTMHAYAEYLQEYVQHTNGLAAGGKLHSDFRVTSWGRYLRKLWIDEIPMLLNFFKGEMKLIGVRPISRHYFMLYNEETKNLRITQKPGLLPPFYADMPRTIEEIMESETKYIRAYIERPRTTDLAYGLSILKNLFNKKNLSQ